MKFIEQLQKKPERERKQIALALTLALFAGVLAVWGLLVRADRAEVSAVTGRTTPSPFEALANVFKASVATPNPTFERSPAPVADETAVREGGAVVVEHVTAGTTSTEITTEAVPEETPSLEILPPPAP